MAPAGVDVGGGRAALDAFAALVPERTRCIAETFPEYQWMLIRLVEANRWAADLAESNAVLAFCLANSFEFNTTPKREIIWEQTNYYARRKQRLILRWLGYPDTGAMVRFMKKIDPAAVSVGRMRLLRQALKAEPGLAAMFGHFPTVTAGMLGMCHARLEKLVTPHLLEEMAAREDEQFVEHIPQQLIHALDTLRQMGSDRKLKRFRSLAKVQEFIESVEHEQRQCFRRLRELREAREAALEAERRRRRQVRKNARHKDVRRCVWPPPPFPGNSNILPITSYDMLAEEGRAMGHCVRSHWNSIVRGSTYIYRVLWPERATLSIYTSGGGIWHISQIKGPHNRRVGKETRRFAEQWLWNNSYVA